MGGDAANAAMPRGQHTVALHIAVRRARDLHQCGRAMVPQSAGPTAQAAIALTNEAARRSGQ